MLAMPRAWALQTIERVAAECLDLTDDWQYRRLMELAGDIDSNLVQRLVKLRLASNDKDILEAARDFYAE